MKTEETNSIRYPAAVDEKLEKLALKLGRTKKQLFCQMVDYFYRSKKDPSDLNDEALKRQLSAGVNRVLSFIKRQEQDFILPIHTATGVLQTAAEAHTTKLGNISTDLEKEEEKTKRIGEGVARLELKVKAIATSITDKETLKQRFGQILEYYIQQREEMGWTTSAAKKDELLKHVRQSLKNL